MFQNSHTNNQFSFNSSIKLIKLKKLEPQIKQMNQVVPQNTLRGRSFKCYFFNPTGGQQCKFRRKTCTCSECGETNAFVEKQNALQPITYIRAHHIKKRKRKMYRNKGGGRHLSAMIIRVPLQNQDNNNFKKERKGTTLLQNQFIQQKLYKCKTLQTKDDNNIGYEYFFANELKIANETQEFITITTIDKTQTQIKQQNFALNGSQKTIDESQITITKNMNMNMNQSQITNTQFPRAKCKIKQKPSVHSPRVYEDILQSHNLKPNRTVDKYISQSAHCSPAKIKFPLISQKQIIQTKRKKSNHIYLKGSPLKLLFELKSQVLLLKKK
ncbi:unnamed protein product [Paramecium primaurelia]|uniref:Uncharacterized protein n=1 Tax=Paramecium primaurelia TaxID=5886 RepID=A0A8S1NPA5_PARPR|nr:unnamed protein product [Paramecium primaurelia]